MANSTSPPAGVPKSGNGALIGAAVVMVLLIGGLLWWKVGGKKEEPVAATPPPPPATTEAPMLEAPPPPPPKEEPDAGEEKKPSGTKAKYTGGGAGGCGGTCTGTASAALRSALRSKAGAARGCYERALRQNSMLQGKITVAVRISKSGSVCSANIGSNSLGDPGVASCVLGIFRSGSFPPPEGGCVDAQVPMNFVPKT